MIDDGKYLLSRGAGIDDFSGSAVCSFDFGVWECGGGGDFEFLEGQWKPDFRFGCMFW